MTTTEPLSLKVSRLIKAPRARVFAALTTPAAITKWLGCGPCKAVLAKTDLRVGGEFRFRMQSNEPGEFEIFGVYREIKAPERLVFTWNYANCGPAEDGSETLVTIDLSEEETGTLVQLTHEGFPSAELCDQHVAGWNECLEKIETLV